MRIIQQGIKILCGLCLVSSMSATQAQQQAIRETDFETVSPFVSPMMTNPSAQENLDATQTVATPPVSDPWESMNRKIFSFNDALDTCVLVPIARTYNKIMPKPLNRGIYNAFANLNNFPTISNDLLQGNFYQATSDSWRFIINSTAGVGGLFDVAQNMGLESNSEDFGLTLARWGYTDSNYLVLPFFGPSTTRDTLGMPVDYFLFNPYDYISHDMRTLYTLYALNIVSKRTQLLQYQNLYNQIALDRYTFIRDAYLQQRNNAIERNQQLSDPYFNLTDRSSHQNVSS